MPETFQQVLTRALQKEGLLKPEQEIKKDESVELALERLQMSAAARLEIAKISEQVRAEFDKPDPAKGVEAYRQTVRPPEPPPTIDKEV